MKAQYETALGYRRLDENGDMVFGQSNTGILQDRAAMAQVLKTRLAAVEGEWWEGDDGALPYFSEILGARGSEENRKAFDLMVVERIMDTIGVLSVENVESTFEHREYRFKCDVNTVYGSIQVEVSR